MQLSKSSQHHNFQLLKNRLSFWEGYGNFSHMINLRVQSWRVGVAVLAAAWLGACVPRQTPQQIAFWHEMADRPVTCVKGADCDEKWERAIKWVEDHATKRIRVIDDRMIQTYSLVSNDHPPVRVPEFTIVRYRESGGKRYVIRFST